VLGDLKGHYALKVEETIKQLDDKILNAYNMFPLLCMMYAASESNPGVRFFQYPIKAIKKQLGKMNKQNEQAAIFNFSSLL
jgi:hypothetical protein